MTKVKICCIQSIAEAVKQVNPYGVDVCSGIRTDGKLDEEKMRQFINLIKN